MSNFEFPHTRTYDSDLGWLIKTVKWIQEQMKTFISVNELKFADPLLHDISNEYEKNTLVLDGDGNMYLSLKPVPVGVDLGNPDYWMMVFNFDAYIERANKNLTDNYFKNVSGPDHALNIGDWLLLNDVLYKVIVAISANEDFVIGTNIVHFTVEDFLKDFITTVNNTILQYKNDIDASELQYKNELALQITDITASLQAQLDNAISGVTVDSEVINARGAYNGYTFPTLGNHIRTMFENIGILNQLMNKNANVTITGAGLFYNTSVVNSCAIPIKTGDTIKITANASNPTIFAFLDAYSLPVTDGTSADFSDDYPARMQLTANITDTYTVFDNAAYLWILYNDNGTDRIPQHVYVNGVDMVSQFISNTFQPLADEYQNHRTAVGRAFEFDNISKMVAVNEPDDKIAHGSNIAIDENGLTILAYYGNKDSYVEDYSDNSTAFVKIRKFYNEAPEKAETILTVSNGFESDTHILARGCPSNANVMYNENGKFYIYFSGFFTDKLTTVEDFGYLCIVYDTATMDFERSDGFIKTYKVNIDYSGQDYWASNGGLTNLYAALGDIVTDPYVQFSGNLSKHTNGYYYTFICGIGYKAVLVRTIDFITFEYVALFYDGTNVITPEIDCQWQTDFQKLVINYRVNDTGNEGTYLALYTIATNTFTYKGMISVSNSKPAVIKDYFRNIVMLYNIPEKQRPVFKRNGYEGCVYMAYREGRYKIFSYNEYPMAVHYPSCFNQGVFTYFTISTGKSGCRVGTDYDTIQFGYFGPIR